MAAPGKTIRIYLAEGSASGILIAEVGNWTGKITVCPRTALAKLSERPDTKRTGLYALAGPDPEKASKERVYVGESDNVFKRLVQHDRDLRKDFWSRAVIVASKDENLTKAHGRYLESRLIELAVSAGRSVLANGTAPERPALPEPDIADMEYFLNQVRLVLPVLGFNFLKPVASQEDTTGPDDSMRRSPIFQLKSVGAEATAQELDGRFVVFKNSTARKNPGYENWTSYHSLRDRLVEDGMLADSLDENLLVFVEDVEFSSPSAAAAVVCASSKNGPTSWKSVETGQTYRQWHEARFETARLEQ